MDQCIGDQRRRINKPHKFLAWNNRRNLSKDELKHSAVCLALRWSTKTKMTMWDTKHTGLADASMLADQSSCICTCTKTRKLCRVDTDVRWHILRNEKIGNQVQITCYSITKTRSAEEKTQRFSRSFTRHQLFPDEGQRPSAAHLIALQKGINKVWIFKLHSQYIFIPTVARVHATSFACLWFSWFKHNEGHFPEHPYES